MSVGIARRAVGDLAVAVMTNSELNRPDANKCGAATGKAGSYSRDRVVGLEDATVAPVRGSLLDLVHALSVLPRRCARLIS